MRYYILFNMLLIAFGCLLPWLIPGLFVVGLRGIQMMDGKIVLALAVIGLLAIAYHLVSRRGFDWLYGVVGLATAVISGMDGYSFYKSGYTIGPGVYLVALGALQLIGSYIVLLIEGGEKKFPPR